MIRSVRRIRRWRLLWVRLGRRFFRRIMRISYDFVFCWYRISQLFISWCTFCIPLACSGISFVPVIDNTRTKLARNDEKNSVWKAKHDHKAFQCVVWYGKRGTKRYGNIWCQFMADKLNKWLGGRESKERIGSAIPNVCLPRLLVPGNMLITGRQPFRYNNG